MPKSGCNDVLTAPSGIDASLGRHGSVINALQSLAEVYLAENPPLILGQ